MRYPTTGTARAARITITGSQIGTPTIHKMIPTTIPPTASCHLRDITDSFFLRDHLRSRLLHGSALSVRFDDIGCEMMEPDSREDDMTLAMPIEPAANELLTRDAFA